ncbi:acyl carrier protein [Pandoraea fibrosis]|uniref:Acyl carrier protein n=1 Tax=Pandoraea fibrosis TaxID=1891094 RepID=A0A5E4XX78_9BURK|nr:acyl carrier protein [Pandoraea fibrosis]QHE94225.1 acyl carrier protein [Pandoraea fibrosis]QHF12211.1 acyl carrier protein [Pandoraea fibrosis]VVE40976.1 acyl carrier protein [Pandoraea fibrosis]
MTINEIESKIAELIGNIVMTQVEPDTLLIDSGLVDSLSAVDVVLAVEREFGVKVPPSEIDVYLESVHTLAAFVAEQKGA